MDPRARLIAVFLAGTLAVLLERPLALSLLVVACGIPLLAARVPARWWLRGGLAVAGVLYGTVFSQGLFYSDEPRVPLISIGPVVLWREGVTYGLVQSLRFLSVLLAGLSVAALTPPDQMIRALRGLGLPASLALLVATALRFVPDIGREWLAVRVARSHRGRPVWRRTPWSWLALEVALLQPVVARTWRRAQTLAESLDARGLDPSAVRTERTTLRWRGVDTLFIGLVGLVALWVATAKLLFSAYTHGVLYVPELRALYGFVRYWL